MSIDIKNLNLPNAPGIYFFKDKNNNVIYIGKAANLKNRVSQYFHKNDLRDSKTQSLIAEIDSVSYNQVESEIAALFLEAEQVRRYLPKYNILLRDDKSSAYIKISTNKKVPSVSIARRPINDGAKYFGPYFNTSNTRRALKILRRAFPYSTHEQLPQRACLEYHLGLCPGVEEYPENLSKYNEDIKRLIQYLNGKSKTVLKQLEKQMKIHVNKQEFEKAALIRNQMFAIKNIGQQIIFSRDEFIDISKDFGLDALCKLLKLDNAPKQIEGFDISHIQGTDNVASMVVFVNGIPDKASYRKFNLSIIGNDDFAHMNEVIMRRLSKKNINNWGKPDLILIDGGKGQLKSAINARDASNINLVPIIGLAKRNETVVIHKTKSNPKIILDAKSINQVEQNPLIVETDDFINVTFDSNSHIVKLLQRIRDESHRFAVSHHHVVKTNKQTTSILDEIPGLGPVTKKKLLKEFGSLKAIKSKDIKQIEKLIGSAKAQILTRYLSDNDN